MSSLKGETAQAFNRIGGSHEPFDAAAFLLAAPRTVIGQERARVDPAESTILRPQES